jgi:hypothetical protein
MADPNAPQDPFEMFRRLWGPLGVPVPGMAMPTMDPKEVEKRVADLKSVEAWLAMNLNMVRFAIQGLEMQRSALEAMKSGASGDAAGDGRQGRRARRRAGPGAGGGAREDAREDAGQGAGEEILNRIPTRRASQ